MDTSELLLIIFSTLTVCASAPIDALWCNHHPDWEQRWWRRVKLFHTFAGLSGFAVFLYLAIVNRFYCWPSVLAIWISAFMIGGDSVFFLFFYREKITDRLSKLARSGISSAIRRYRRLKDLALSPLWPSPRDEILPFHGVSLPKPAAGSSRSRDYPGTPPNPVPPLSGGRTGLSVPQPAVLPGGTLESSPHTDTRPNHARDEGAVALRPLRPNHSTIPIGTIQLMELRARGVGKTPIQDKYFDAGGESVPGRTDVYPKQRCQLVDGKWYNVLLHDFGVAGPDDELTRMVNRAVAFVIAYNETRDSLDSIYDIAVAISSRPATLVCSHQLENNNPKLREEAYKAAKCFGWKFVNVSPASSDADIEGIFVDLLQRSIRPSSIGLGTETHYFDLLV